MVKVSHYKLQNGSVLVQWKLLPKGELRKSRIQQLELRMFSSDGLRGGEADFQDKQEHWEANLV